MFCLETDKIAKSWAKISMSTSKLGYRLDRVFASDVPPKFICYLNYNEFPK